MSTVAGNEIVNTTIVDMITGVTIINVTMTVETIGEIVIVIMMTVDFTKNPDVTGIMMIGSDLGQVWLLEQWFMPGCRLHRHKCADTHKITLIIVGAIRIQHTLWLRVGEDVAHDQICLIMGFLFL